MVRPKWKDEPEARGISVEVVMKLEDVPDIRGTDGELEEILLNLLLNCVDAMPHGGTITFHTRQANAAVELSVTDTGIGMGEETRRRVFEPFFTTHRGVGSGLGLSTVYGTVRRWGGSIDVESVLGGGTTFTLRFPLCDEQDIAEGEQSAASPQGLVRPARALLVEDDEATCSALDRILSEIHTVEIAQSGGDALEGFVPGRFDVALIDLGLETIPGDRVAEEMRARDPALATVLITGWVLEDDDPRLAEFDFRMQKPVPGERLQATVARAIKLHDARAGVS